MPFNKELEDFAQAFSSGYQMVKSPDEREALRTETAYNKGRLELMQEELTPENKRLRRQERLLGLDKTRADVGHTQAETGRLEQVRKRLEHENSEAYRQREQAVQDADIAYKQYLADSKNAEAERALRDAQARKTAAEARIVENEADLDDLFKTSAPGMATPGSAPISDTPSSAVDTSQPGDENFMVPRSEAVVPGLGPRRMKDVDYGAGPAPAPASAVDTEDPRIMNLLSEPLGYSGNDQPTGTTGLSGVRLNPAQFAIEDMRRNIDPNLRTPEEGGYNPQADDESGLTGEAARSGMQHLMQLSGLNQEYAVGTPASEQGGMDFLTNVNAASPETVEMGKDTIQEREPNRQMSENEKNRKFLTYGYKFFMDHGRPDKAKRFAAGVMGHYQYMAGQYGLFAQAAAEGGDPDGAAEALMRAYDYIPSGNILKITKSGDGYLAEIRPDGGGKPIFQKIMKPEEIMGAAMGITPASFVPMMEQALGIESKSVSPAFARDYPEYEGYEPGEVSIAEKMKRGDKSYTTGGGKKSEEDTTGLVIKPADRAQVELDVENAMVKLEGEFPGVYGDPDKANEEVTPTSPPQYYRDDVKRATYDIVARTPGIMYSDAVEAARSLVKTRPDHVKKIKNNMVEIKYDNLLSTVTMNEDVYRGMSTLRNRINRKGQPTLSEEWTKAGEALSPYQVKQAKLEQDRFRREEVMADRANTEDYVVPRGPRGRPIGITEQLEKVTPDIFGPSTSPASRANAPSVLAPRAVNRGAVPVEEGPAPSATSIPTAEELQMLNDLQMFGWNMRRPIPRAPIPVSPAQEAVPITPPPPIIGRPSGGMGVREEQFLR